MLKYSVCLNKEQHTIKHFKGTVLIKSENSYILRSHINLHIVNLHPHLYQWLNTITALVIWIL